MVYIGLNTREVTAFEFIPELEKTQPKEIKPEEVVELLSSYYHSCFRNEHKPVLDIVKRRFNINIGIPEEPILYPLRKGDKVIIVVVANTRRLGYEEKYTLEELRKARIFFRQYIVR